MVNIDDSMGKLADKLRREYSHIFSQYYVVRAVLVDDVGSGILLFEPVASNSESGSGAFHPSHGRIGASTLFPYNALQLILLKKSFSIAARIPVTPNRRLGFRSNNALTQPAEA